MKKITFLWIAVLSAAIIFGFAACDDEKGGNGGKDDVFMEMVSITGGTFTMGNDAGEGREKPAHQVKVNNFFIGKYEVTQAQYEEVMGNNPSASTGANKPVEQVLWYDAVKFCNALSTKENLTPAYDIDETAADPSFDAFGQTTYGTYYKVVLVSGANGYRLPTSAEWEYACRAGTTTVFNTENDLTDNDANFGENTDTTMNVGSFKPNKWGLYDMHGNVMEWCWDLFDDTARPNNATKSEYYESFTGIADNPLGPEKGWQRVSRGGAFSNGSNNRMGSAYPERSHPARMNNAGTAPYYNDLGFRVVRSK